ncbi:glycosyltransferase family 4 protein [Butyrivibrio sp. WCD3002]|uniref:glycosyltransferase family 4 protein n=1 Tax=Butyrivibrio sp. WCD3002 TaxID=1280676 RepID=UPI0003FD9455|nr:glycosyltransferase family 4 protein [Butyrivibrio sp. WCD3002]
MKSFGRLCDRVILVINSNYPNRTDDYDKNIEALTLELKENKWDSEEVLSLADNAFQNDVQLYILFLSAVYLCTMDSAYLVQIENILLKDSLDMSMTTSLLFQTRYFRFIEGKNDDYPFRRKVYRHIATRFLNKLGASIDMIPYDKRDHELVFVVTGQLLDERHAPSRIVLSICYYLQKYFGYLVQLIVTGEPIDTNATSAYWSGDIVMPTYMPYWGDQVYRFHDEDIHYYQIDLNSSTKEKILDVIGKLYIKRPEFILQFGGFPMTDLVWRSMSTFISIPAGNNYDVSDAHLLVSYQKNDADAEEEEKYIHSLGQETLFINMQALPLTENSKEEEYTKKAFGIDPDSFTIVIAGNRLDDEITDEFKDVMNRIINENDNVTFVLIGKYELPLPEGIDSHTVRLGYREDFVQTVCITDLFLNPKRAGGSGGALRSMSNGIPVITLPDCDVSAFTGEDFVCDSYDEMVSLTHRYITDAEFYTSQSQKARQHFNERNVGVNMKEQMQKLVDKALEIGRTQK